jgi:hypothetical protein
MCLTKCKAPHAAKLWLQLNSISLCLYMLRELVPELITAICSHDLALSRSVYLGFASGLHCYQG